MNYLVAATFVVGTLVLLYVSLASLRAPKFHGFYRFFAWEAILLLAVLNLPNWFDDPFTWHQIISWALLLASLFLVVGGVRLLRRKGQPDPRRDDGPLIAVEKTTRLVTTCIYNYTRHPLYTSLLCLAWAIFLKSPSCHEGLMAAAATLLLTITARIEETENIRFFGSAYCAYMQRTKMFIPYLF